MYILCFYVPASHLESVKTELFNIGVGKFNNYDQCCWQTLGKGQFRALDQAKPYIGKHKKLKIVEEWKVEMVCPDNLIEQAVEILKIAHPYEEVAYHALPFKHL